MTVKYHKEFRTAYCTCANGYQWATSINGSNESIRKYFMGSIINTSSYPGEVMSRVVNVAIM